MLIIHISIALVSLIWTTILYVKPSQAKKLGAYGLVAGTITSGTLLVVSTGSNILQSCVSGLVYLAVVSVGITLASRKLARQEQ
jgi:hypothetical protein